ncbi:LysR family transcriptional regulator [Rhizobium halophytocola]|uniref:DNA-binding transcriptional LysR family regulator n=1 Tax=Rhizobium halophytocola TaxID=735519 RepID=A0ABS4E4N5_9HYPH|nr:LysR family transcriptional regulator [Rhizobium halophytocola]MBP1852883.1 DNA-binding transcriptional LysR family regulator [Rhizobium halophytocola]
MAGRNRRLQHKTAGIEEFLRVAEALSFSRAAESLGQASSATSKSVAKLEARLGVRLFHRTTRSVKLTEEGALLYARASRWAEELEEMQSVFLQDPEELGGVIRLEMPASLGRALVLPVLGRFLSAHPKLKIEVRMNDHHVNLVAEGVDLALRVGQLSNDDLVAKPLGVLRQGTYACPNCLSTFGRPGVPNDLLSHRLISLVPPSGRHRPMVYCIEGNDIAIDTRGAVATFTNGEAMVDAAIAGIGITQAPEIYARQAVRSGALIQVLTGQDAPGNPVQLVYPSRRRLPRRVRALKDFMVDTLLGESALCQDRH